MATRATRSPKRAAGSTRSRRRVEPALAYRSVRTGAAYDALVKRLYAGVREKVEVVDVPPIRAIAFAGNEPPGSPQYQEAIAALYGIAYSLKMGLKLRKLPRPARYFDYKVGALETIWWTTGKTFDISNPATFRWEAHLMVPPFVTQRLLDAARKLVQEKHPEVPYHAVRLVAIEEGRSVQTLHVGPYDREQPTLDRLHAYMAEHDLAVRGRHHEVYLNDPRRARAAKTVIRLPVQAGARGKSR